MPALLTSASIRPNRVTAVSAITAAVFGVTDVSVNQRKIRRRRERIGSGDVSASLQRRDNHVSKTPERPPRRSPVRRR